MQTLKERNPPVPRMRSGQRSRGSKRRIRSRTASSITPERQRASFIEHSSDDIFLVLNLWRIHGTIASVVLYVETEIAQNFVAAFLLLPQFSIKKMRIRYIFNGRADNPESFRSTIIVVYSILVTLSFVVIGCTVSGG